MGRPGGEGNRTTTRKKTIGTVVLLVALALMVLFLGYTFASPWLEQVDPKWVKCEVYSSSPTRTGTRVTGYTVKLATSCGQVWYNKGVRADNVKEAARQFVPHTDYDFRFGWLSRVYLSLGSSGATAESWRKAP